MPRPSTLVFRDISLKAPPPSLLSKCLPKKHETADPVGEAKGATNLGTAMEEGRVQEVKSSTAPHHRHEDSIGGMTFECVYCSTFGK